MEENDKDENCCCLGDLLYGNCILAGYLIHRRKKGDLLRCFVVWPDFLGYFGTQEIAESGGEAAGGIALADVVEIRSNRSDMAFAVQLTSGKVVCLVARCVEEVDNWIKTLSTLLPGVVTSATMAEWKNILDWRRSVAEIPEAPTKIKNQGWFTAQEWKCAGCPITSKDKAKFRYEFKDGFVLCQYCCARFAQFQSDGQQKFCTGMIKRWRPKHDKWSVVFAVISRTKLDMYEDLDQFIAKKKVKYSVEFKNVTACEVSRLAIKITMKTETEWIEMVKNSKAVAEEAEGDVMRWATSLEQLVSQDAPSATFDWGPHAEIVNKKIRNTLQDAVAQQKPLIDDGQLTELRKNQLRKSFASGPAEGRGSSPGKKETAQIVPTVGDPENTPETHPDKNPHKIPSPKSRTISVAMPVVRLSTDKEKTCETESEYQYGVSETDIEDDNDSRDDAESDQTLDDTLKKNFKTARFEIHSSKNYGPPFDAVKQVKLRDSMTVRDSSEFQYEEAQWKGWWPRPKALTKIPSETIIFEGPLVPVKMQLGCYGVLSHSRLLLIGTTSSKKRRFDISRLASAESGDGVLSLTFEMERMDLELKFAFPIGITPGVQLFREWCAAFASMFKARGSPRTSYFTLQTAPISISDHFRGGDELALLKMREVFEECVVDVNGFIAQDALLSLCSSSSLVSEYFGLEDPQRLDTFTKALNHFCSMNGRLSDQPMSWENFKMFASRWPAMDSKEIGTPRQRRRNSLPSLPSPKANPKASQGENDFLICRFSSIGKPNKSADSTPPVPSKQRAKSLPSKRFTRLEDLSKPRLRTDLTRCSTRKSSKSYGSLSTRASSRSRD